MNYDGKVIITLSRNARTISASEGLSKSQIERIEDLMTDIIDIIDSEEEAE